MEITDALEFTDRGRKDLYEYVERHGVVRESRARRALNMDPEEFGHHLTVLRRDGYVRTIGDRLQVAYSASEPEIHEADGTTFVVRTAEQSDREGLIEVVRAVAQDGSYIEAETVAEVLDHEETILRHNHLQSRIFFVATVEDDVIGWVHLERPETAKLSHTAELTVGVLAQYRGQGIGGRLLERGTEWAAERGTEKLYNSVPPRTSRVLQQRHADHRQQYRPGQQCLYEARRQHPGGRDERGLQSLPGVPLAVELRDEDGQGDAEDDAERAGHEEQHQRDDAREYGRRGGGAAGAGGDGAAGEIHDPGQDAHEGERDEQAEPRPSGGVPVAVDAGQREQRPRDLRDQTAHDAGDEQDEGETH